MKECIYIKCEKYFTPTNKKHVYCSKSCFYKQQRVNNKLKKSEIRCSYIKCNNYFVPVKSDQRFCSSKCSTYQWRIDNPEKNKEIGRRWTKNNPEKIREKNKEYRFNNPEKIYELNKAYKANNPDKIRKWNKTYSLNHKEEISERGKRWAENNPEKIRERDYRRKALKSKLNPIPDGFMENQLIKQNYKCGNIFCRCDLSKLPNRDVTIEHLTPLYNGGTNDPENLRIWCRSCNCSKSAKTLEEFYFSECE